MKKYVPPQDVDNVEDLVDDMIVVSSDFASGMLDEYRETFGIQSEGGGHRSERRRNERRGRRRKGDPSGGDGED